MNDQDRRPAIEKPKPKVKLPAIENLPATRPHCVFCGKLMPMMTDYTREERPGGSSTSVVLRRVWRRWDGYPWREPLFHSLSCALKFAIAAHRAGYRMVTKS